MSETTQRRVATPAEVRKVAAATTIGTTIEWYDFFLYANAAGLIFNQLFFKPLGDNALIVSFATVGVSFLFRPLGAVLAGHFGDRYGRKKVLVATLLLMGAATTMIGVLPTYAQIGLMAPVLLCLLRILQGLSTGGEWGGAVLMAVEHAPEGKRGLMGAFPQIGVPIGLLLANGVLAIMTAWISPGEQFLQWGWRIPFLLSFILIVVGIIVRRSVEESPVFTELAQRKERTKTPILNLLRSNWLLILLAALTFAGNNAAGYMTTGGFLQSYASRPVAEGGVGMELTQVLLAIVISSLIWLICTLYGGWLSDKIGRRRTYLIGWGIFLVTVISLFPLVQAANMWAMTLGVALFAIGNGLTYGPQAAFFSELFPASVRFSGVSISYALGAILGGAFAPAISAWLMKETGTSWSVTAYLIVMILIGLTGSLLLKDRSNVPLGVESEVAEQKDLLTTKS